MKRTWDFSGEGCDMCEYRFQCFTDAGIVVKPSRVDEDKIKDDSWVNRNRTAYQFKAEFHTPKCLRLGLFKQLNDTGYWGGGQDGFKFGEIKADDGEKINPTHVYVKFPDRLFVMGKRYE